RARADDPRRLPAEDVVDAPADDQPVGRSAAAAVHPHRVPGRHDERRLMAMPTTAPLWPVANRPEDLLEIERTPLEDRGLPASTYDVLCRAARVALQPGSTVTEDELCAWAAEHVPERAAAPKAVEVIDAIPLTPISKPFKNELRRLATERAARDVLPDGATV